MTKLLHEKQSRTRIQLVELGYETLTTYETFEACVPTDETSKTCKSLIGK